MPLKRLIKYFRATFVYSACLSSIAYCAIFPPLFRARAGKRNAHHGPRGSHNISLGIWLIEMQRKRKREEGGEEGEMHEIRVRNTDDSLKKSIAKARFRGGSGLADDCVASSAYWISVSGCTLLFSLLARRRSSTRRVNIRRRSRIKIETGEENDGRNEKSTNK